MKYYATFDSHSALVNIGINQIIEDEYGSADVVNTEVPQELYEDYKACPDKYIAGEIEIEGVTVPYPVIDPDYKDKQAEKREAEFNKEFFNTSLGYIRRAVTMADGSKKDFLSDLLPVISMGVQSGQEVSILAYDAPDFTQDVEDWTEYQHKETVTAQFIQECFLQLGNDFLPINEE